MKNDKIHLCWYGGRGGSGGYLNYLKGILCSGAIPDNCKISLICSHQLADSLGQLDHQVEVVPVKALSSTLRSKWWLKTSFQRFVKSLSPDLLFYASGSLVPPPKGIPAVAPCHSILFFDDVEYAKYRFSWMWLKYLFPMRALHFKLYPKMAGIIFFTDYSRRLVAGQIPCLVENVTIAHGVETEFIMKEGEGSPNPENPFTILYVSTINMYKHQWNVVKAVKKLRFTTGRNYQLILAGSADPVAGPVLAQCIKDENADSFTRRLGFVNHHDLPELYRKAGIFVYASSCESFGITLLEAMGSGLPIVCSGRSGLPDLLKDAGEYFDPERPDSIAEAIARLDENPERRLECVQKGVQYAKEYTWHRCAERTLSFLQKIAYDQRVHRQDHVRTVQH